VLFRSHGPGWGHLDTVLCTENHLGCEVLDRHVQQRVKPLIHACGHIHTGRGYKFYNDTHYINSSILNEKYVPVYNPINTFLNTEFVERKNFISLIET
jgi:Icc-related predicted phosphoesterase